MNDILLDQLKDLTLKDKDSIWKSNSYGPDIKHTYGPDIVNIKPKDAKTIDDVKSFTAIFEISGHEEVDFDRK